ncbi:unnamed protein product, partial [Closterium sp. NIES-54]
MEQSIVTSGAGGGGEGKEGGNKMGGEWHELVIILRSTACCLLSTACCLCLCLRSTAYCLLSATCCLLPLPAAVMMTPNFLAFEPDGRPIEFAVWLDDLQLFLLTDAKEGVSLFDDVSGTAVAPAADAPALERSQWQTRDAAARLAIRNHLPITKRAHFSHHKTAKTLYDAVVARYSSPATATIDLLRRDVPIFDLDYEAILATMYVFSVSAEGDCYLCVPPDPGIAPAALGACESAPLGTAPTQALHTFTLDSGASRCFFRDSTTVTPLPAPVPVSLADPSGGPVLARSSTVLPCPAVPSGELSGLHLPSFSTNLVSNAVLQDAGVDTFTPGRQRVAVLYVLPDWPPPGHVHSCARVQSVHPHHCVPLRPFVSPVTRVCSGSYTVSLLALPPSPAPPCIPCVEGRQRAAPHSSSFPPTEAPLQTLHLDDPAARLQLRERFQSDFPVLRLHSDRGGEFSSDLLAAYCVEHGIRQTFTLSASLQQNGVAERRIGLVMEVARTSMIHAAAPHFLWPFPVRYATHQLNLWPRVSLPETSPTLRWTGKVGDASRFRVWVGPLLPPLPLPHCSSPPPPSPPLFLTPGPPQVDPLPAPGPTPSGVSQVDPPAPAPVEVTGDSGPAGNGAVPGGAELGGAASGGAASGGAASGGPEPACAEPGGAESGGESREGSETAFTRSPSRSRLRPR